jgi:hypothetical protein
VGRTPEQVMEAALRDIAHSAPDLKEISRRALAEASQLKILKSPSMTPDFDVFEAFLQQPNLMILLEEAKEQRPNPSSCLR